MKGKIIIIILLTFVIVFSGCGKNGANGALENNSKLVSYFDLGVSLLGTNLSDAETILNDNGWTYCAGGLKTGSDIKEYLYWRSISDHSASIKLFFYEPSNIICRFIYDCNKGDKDSIYNNETEYLNLVKHIGSSYTIKSGLIYTYEYNNHSYNELISNFSNIWNDSYWMEKWLQGNDWNNGGIRIQRGELYIRDVTYEENN